MPYTLHTHIGRVGLYDEHKGVLLYILTNYIIPNHPTSHEFQSRTDLKLNNAIINFRFMQTAKGISLCPGTFLFKGIFIKSIL